LGICEKESHIFLTDAAWEESQRRLGIPCEVAGIDEETAAVDMAA